MVLKCFIKASSEKKAIKVLSSWLMEKQQIQYSKLTAEAYWKIDGVFVTKATDIRQDDIHLLLDLLADHWIEIGNPVDEYIAAENDQNQTYIRDDLLMAHIYKED